MRYVIIGNSAAATGAVEGIRDIDKNGQIIVISKENCAAYSRPLISYFLAGKVSHEKMYFRPPAFYEQHQVDYYWGEEVTSLSTETKSVHIEPRGMDLTYDKLLIATGGEPVLPTCFGGDYENLFYFHKWDDVERINSYLNGKMKIVVVGGGLIGLKAAESLWMRGQDISIIEAGPYLLNSILDNTAAGIVQHRFTSRGIKVILSNPVTGVVGNQNITGLFLQDGSQLDCDMVVMAAGVRPNTGWLSNSAINIPNGIQVDNYLETSVNDIFAAGDVIQLYDELSSSYRIVPIWPHAYRQGKIAGSNMAGSRIIHLSEPAFNSIPLLGLNIATAGLSTAMDTDLDIIERMAGEWNYKKLVIKDDILLGFILTGDVSRCGIYRMLIGKKTNISSLRNQMEESGIHL